MKFNWRFLSIVVQGLISLKRSSRSTDRGQVTFHLNKNKNRAKIEELHFLIIFRGVYELRMKVLLPAGRKDFYLLNPLDLGLFYRPPQPDGWSCRRAEDYYKWKFFSNFQFLFKI